MKKFCIVIGAIAFIMVFMGSFKTETIYGAQPSFTNTPTPVYYIARLTIPVKLIAGRRGFDIPKQFEDNILSIGEAVYSADKKTVTVLVKFTANTTKIRAVLTALPTYTVIIKAVETPKPYYAPYDFATPTVTRVITK